MVSVFITYKRYRGKWRDGQKFQLYFAFTKIDEKSDMLINFVHT